MALPLNLSKFSNIMYDIKQRQIQNAKKKHKERLNLIELLQKSNIELTQTEKENIMIFGDIRGPYASPDTRQITIYEGWKEDFSDYDILKELLEYTDE